MRESENAYPPHEPVKGRSRRASNEDEIIDAQTDLPEEFTLPHNGLLYSLSAGLLGGLVVALISVAITLINASAFQEAARLQDRMSFATASTLTGLTCLSYFIALVICFASGFVAGHFAVRRMYGFYAGALAGALTYIGGFVVQYIPNSPGHIASNSSVGALAGGIVFVLVLLLIYAVLGALMGLWGAQVATRRHPYYRVQVVQEEE